MHRLSPALRFLVVAAAQTALVGLIVLLAALIVLNSPALGQAALPDPSPGLALERPAALP